MVNGNLYKIQYNYWGRGLEDSQALQWLKKIFKENYTVVILRVVNDYSAVVKYIKCQLDQPTDRPPTGSVTKQCLSKKLHDLSLKQEKGGTTSQWVKIECFLSLTVSTNSSLDCGPVSDTIAYPAGCTYRSSVWHS